MAQFAAANAAMCVAPQDRAQGDHQQFVDVVQAGIAGPRVLQPLKAGDKVIQHGLPRRSWLAGVEPIRLNRASTVPYVKGIPSAMPLGRGLTGRHVLVVMKSATNSGASWGIMTRGDRLRQTFDNDMKFIEIGPSHYPIVPKAQGWRTTVVDHAGRSELLAKYAELSVARPNILRKSTMSGVDGPLIDAIPLAVDGKFEV